MSHKLYLEECQSKEMCPRALNVAKLVKSVELKDSEGCYDILKEASDKLVANQLSKWDIRLGQLNQQKDVYMQKLRSGLSQEEFKQEQALIVQHVNNVMKVEQEKKRTKILRDTDEINMIKGQYTVKKKKQRRFRRKENEQLNVNSVDSNQNVMPECRITGKVKNLSSRQLRVPEKELLEKGPKFCPVEQDIDRARFQKDLNQGFRRMKIKDFFYPDVDSRSEEEKRFYVKNDDWEPPSAKVNKALDVHNMVIQNQFDHWKQPLRVKDNLSVDQRKALKNLVNNETIDIKLDDKSGSFVLADKKDYISAASNDLSKQSNIQEINR